MPNSVTERFKRSTPVKVCHHFSRVLQCHVYYLNADNSIRCAFAYGQPSLHTDDSDLLHALFNDENVSGRPVIVETRPGEMYISVDLFENNTFCGRLAAGPIMYITKDFQRSVTSKNHVIENFDNAVSAAIVLYYFVYDEWADEKELLEICIGGRQTENNEVQSSNNSKALSQTENVHHHSIVYENHLLSLITQGNEERLLEMMKTPPDGAYGLLDKEHPLRNLKNDCICTITLATRAAIAGGLDSESAFLLSDEAIQNLELCRDMDSIYYLIEQTLCKFTRMVAITRHLNYSFRINQCRNYVLNHIYEKITVSGIAKYLSLCPEYLSEQFKKETGTLLKDYIQTARTQEAKKLLLYSDKSIVEIASLLNYHDQSHFTKSFKNAFGVTPRQCRETGVLPEPIN